MKNIPQLRFAGFDGEWEEKKFKDITKLSQGLQIPIEDRYLQPSNDTYFYITNEFLKPGSKQHYYIKDPNKSVIANKDDILMTRTGNTGKVLTDVEGAFHNNFFKIAYDNDSISKYYLFYLLNTEVIQNKILALAGSSTILDLNHKDFYSIASSFPPLIEQAKIGDLFRKIDALIEKQEGKVSKMEDFKKSMLQKMFPKKDEFVPEFRFEGFYDKWQRKRLHEIGKTYTSLSGKSADDFGHGEASYVTYMNVYKNPIATLNGVGLIEIDNNQNEVLNGDFFFTTSSETPEEVGLSSAWIYDKSNVYLNSFCFGFRPVIDINISFFAYYFRSENFRREVVMLAQGSTRFNISKKSMMDIKVYYPSIEEQEKIGQFFKNLDTQIETEEKLLESYKQMKKSLLQKMFV